MFPSVSLKDGRDDRTMNGRRCRLKRIHKCPLFPELTAFCASLFVNIFEVSAVGGGVLNAIVNGRARI